MPQTIKPMGLIHKPGTGPNNRFGFKNSGNNKANEDGDSVARLLGKAEASLSHGLEMAQNVINKRVMAWQKFRLKLLHKIGHL